MRFFQRRFGGRMALISHVGLSEWNLVVYNVHLESRGNNLLRSRQFSEIYTDLCQCAPDLSVVVAGDFNFDLCLNHEASVVRDMHFNNPFEACCGAPVSSTLIASPPIDWILTRGPLTASEPRVHGAIRASDHYPLSLTLGRSTQAP
jgi:endonuclease/exonuclease/phosphatase family metal-dependent hydrolase